MGRRVDAIPGGIGFPGVPVAQRGLEPRTADVSDRNSNQAELLRNVIVVRGKEWTRTTGLSLFRGALYHLSYRPIVTAYVRKDLNLQPAD